MLKLLTLVALSQAVADQDALYGGGAEADSADLQEVGNAVATPMGMAAGERKDLGFGIRLAEDTAVRLRLRCMPVPGGPMDPVATAGLGDTQRGDVFQDAFGKLQGPSHGQSRRKR